MTRDDIIRMAREAGMHGMLTDVVCTHDELQRFAALVAAAEREACAKLAEETVCDTHLPTGVKIYGTRRTTMNNGAPTSVGTSNQPEQSVAVRPRNALAARNSVMGCPLRRPERVLPADRRIRTGLEDPATEAAARNEASVHAYAWQSGSNPLAHHPTRHAGHQAPNYKVDHGLPVRLRQQIHVHRLT